MEAWEIYTDAMATICLKTIMVTYDKMMTISLIYYSWQTLYIQIVYILSHSFPWVCVVSESHIHKDCKLG